MNVDTFKRLDGGLMVAVTKMQNTPEQLLSYGASLRQIINYEAGAHDAPVNNARFGKVLAGIKNNKIQAWFVLAGWENCLPKVVGAAIEFPTVITKWNGKGFDHCEGIYGEDNGVLRQAIRELAKERQEGQCFSRKISLGAYLNQVRMYHMIEQGIMGRVGEFSMHSAAMKKILEESGAVLNKEENITVLELKELTSVMKNRWKLPVETECLKKDGQDQSMLPYVFITSWASADKKQQIAASFTEGISTFTGDPIVRVQITSNGNLPYGEIMKDVIASLIEAGHEEIANRGWGRENTNARKIIDPITGRPISSKQNGKCPIIPITASKEEIRRALLLSSEDEITERYVGAEESTLDINRMLGHKVPIMRIHTPNEPEICAVLKVLGAQVRALGPHPMIPGIMSFSDAHKDALGLKSTPARPLRVVGVSETINAPMFGVVG